MFDYLAEHLDEAVKLAERCPEKYQIACFQALIRVLAQFDSFPSLEGKLISGFGEVPASDFSGREAGIHTWRQGEASNRGFVFLGQHQISSQNISQVYHLDGSSYRIIVKDLNEKTKSKKQIKLALLLGVAGLLAGGQPVFSKEKLIEVCQEYGAYDSPNFASHMRKQRNLFIAQGTEWSLTVPAQQRAADAIKELAS